MRTSPSLLLSMHYALCTQQHVDFRAFTLRDIFIEAATADPSKSPCYSICIEIDFALSRLNPPNCFACCKLIHPCFLPKQRVLKLWLTHTASWAAASLTSARQQAMCQR